MVVVWVLIAVLALAFVFALVTGIIWGLKRMDTDPRNMQIGPYNVWSPPPPSPPFPKAGDSEEEEPR
jgi:hypothetical protein